MRVPTLNKNVGLMTAVGLFGWFSGSLYEKYQRKSKIILDNVPGLPVFGTVSAATPLTPQENVQSKFSRVQNRTSEVNGLNFN